MRKFKNIKVAVAGTGYVGRGCNLNCVKACS